MFNFNDTVSTPLPLWGGAGGGVLCGKKKTFQSGIKFDLNNRIRNLYNFIIEHLIELTDLD